MNDFQSHDILCGRDFITIIVQQPDDGVETQYGSGQEIVTALAALADTHPCLRPARSD